MKNSIIKKVILTSLVLLLVSCNLFNAKDKTQETEKSILIVINDISKSNKLTASEFEKEIICR